MAKKTMFTAPRAWYSKIDGYVIKKCFVQSPSEPTIYVKTCASAYFLILSLYVDDLLVIGNNSNLI